MIQELKNLAVGANVNITEANKTNPLPPSSVQSFLKKVKLPGVVIADHEMNYTNR